MRLVTVTDGVAELNYMWLPTWIGQNAQLKRSLEMDLRSKIEGLPFDDTCMDHIDNLIIEYLEQKFPAVVGLRDYLDGLKFVNLVDPNVG